jgi:hypothetical protein
MDPTYHNEFLFGFVASDSKVIVYLKQSTETREYAVKTRHNEITTVVKTSHSLSTALRELAETVAQHSNAFTIWRNLK